MSRVYAIANQKGGVGKTTTAVNLGACLAAAGRTVLVVDMDPQANATSALGFDKVRVEASLYEALIGQRDLAAIVRPTIRDRLALAPSAIQLAGAEIEMVGLLAREQRLRRVLAPVAGSYEFVLIDCPPSLGLLTVNALTAAKRVIVPVQCEYLALEALTQLMSTIQLIRDNLNAELAIAALVLTMHDARTNLGQQVIDEVRRHFPTQAYETVIPRNVRLSEAPSYGQSIIDYDPSSRGGQAYQALAEEFLRREAN